MYLIHTASLELAYFQNSNDVPYAILSHRWEQGEITHQEMCNRTVKDKNGQVKHGYTKVMKACALAQALGLTYLWVDTCCIDKTSSAELSEAINSMFAWYQGAEVCLVYLADVPDVEELERSLWFTRGWTLQELLAPERVEFFNCDWVAMGTKNDLRGRISQITEIPPQALYYGRNFRGWSVAQRFSWAANRVTTRPEDRAYSLLGIFGINMPLLYGEGNRAFIRLQEEIIKQTDDHSIFAWQLTAKPPGWKSTDGVLIVNASDTPRDGYVPTGLLSSSLDHFATCSRVERRRPPLELATFNMTNRGLSISLPMLRFSHSTMLAFLNCTYSDAKSTAAPMTVGIFLHELNEPGQYARTLLKGKDRILCDATCWWRNNQHFPESSLTIDLQSARLELLERASERAVVARSQIPDRGQAPNVSIETRNLFIRQDPMDSAQLSGTEPVRFYIRRFTPFEKGEDFDPVADATVWCVDTWSWNKRRVTLPDLFVGDLFRIHIRQKRVKKRIEGKLPEEAKDLYNKGVYTMPAMFFSFGVHRTTKSEHNFTLIDDPKKEHMLQLKSDSRSDVRVLSDEKPVKLMDGFSWTEDGLRGEHNGGHRQCFYSTEVVGGMEAKVLDLLWAGPSATCDECGKTIDDYQYCCVHCSSPNFDCCTDCFVNLDTSKHDSMLENTHHRFHGVKLRTRQYGGRPDRPRSRRLL